METGVSSKAQKKSPVGAAALAAVCLALGIPALAAAAPPGTSGSIVGWGDQVVVNLDSGFVAISAGSLHSLGLKADGSIVAWGDNDFGQCSVPLPNKGFLAIAVGIDRSLGIKALSSPAESKLWALYW